MTKEDGNGNIWRALESIGEKVPTEVAGSVVVLIAFLWMSPSILDKMMNEAHVNCYLAFLGAIVFGQVFSTSLHAVSKYNERKARSLYKYEPKVPISPSEADIAAKTEKQIEEAVESMKRGEQNAER